MDFDWARAIERNSEALNGIVAALFAMLGLAGEATVAADSAVPAQCRAARAAAGRIRHAPPDHHRGTRPCGEASCLASDFASYAGGGHREGRRPSRPSFQLFDTRKNFASCASTAESSCGIPHASISKSRMIPCGQRPSHSRSRSAARWPGGCRTPQPEAPGPQAGARGSAAPGPASGPLAGQAREHAQVRSSSRRSGRVLRPATAGRRFTWSMRCSPNATGSPGTQ